MASLQSAGARLRRTFQYPNDSGDDDDDDDPTTASAMDEQEQDKLISLLTRQNTLRNEQFAKTLLLLPLAALLAYVRPLLNPHTAVFAILASTSLLISAFLVHKLPPTETGFFPLDVWASGSGSLRKGKMRQPPRTSYSLSSFRSASFTSFFPSRAGLAMGTTVRGAGGGTNGAHVGYGGVVMGADRSPLEAFLPYMNLALVALLMLMGLVRPDARGGGFGWVSMGNMPALIYSVIITAKIVMAGVDPEKELTKLRYDYKGA